MLADLRHAVRAVAAAPLPSLVIVATLAVAIGANTAIFSVVDGVLLSPLGYPNEDDLVMLWEEQPQQGVEKSITSQSNYRDWRERATSFAGQIAAYRHVGFTLTEEDAAPERIGSVQASPLLFELLGVEPLLGRAFRREDEAPGNEHLAILSHASWERRFGADRAVLDTTLSLDGASYTIVGVMPPGFTFPPGDDEVEVWSPLTLGDLAPMERPHRGFLAVGRLAGGAGLAAAQQEMNAIARRLADEYPQANEGWGVRLVPLRTELLGDIGTTLWILMTAVALVLVIGCVNVASILTARAADRGKDFAVRAALGAGRWQLVRRSLAESVVLGLGGAAGALALASAGLGSLRRLIPEGIPRASTASLDGSVLAFAALVSIGAALGFGLLPALRVARPRLAAVLASGGQTTSATGRTRLMMDLLVVAQVALAVVLLVGAGLLVRSFVELSRVDPGFRQEQVVAVAVQLPESRYPGFETPLRFFNELVERVRKVPGIAAAGAVSVLPMSTVGSAFEMPFTVLGLDAVAPTVRPRADYRGVIEGYFEAMGIPLVKGRLFDPFDGNEGREVTLVNEATVRRYFPDEEPLGKRLQMPMAGELEIIGVVGDIRHGGLQSDIRPELYVPYEQLPLRDMHVVVHSAEDPATVALRIREQIAVMDPLLAPTEVLRIDELLYESVAQPRFNTSLLAGLALCAALLAAAGIYGVVSYSVAQRTTEIGIRMAIGADRRRTLTLVLGRALIVVGCGTLTGLVVSFAFSQTLAGLLYAVAPTDAATYLAVCAGAMVLGALAAWIPALRATRVDPVIALQRG